MSECGTAKRYESVIVSQCAQFEFVFWDKDGWNFSNVYTGTHSTNSPIWTLAVERYMVWEANWQSEIEWRAPRSDCIVLIGEWEKRIGDQTKKRKHWILLNGKKFDN